LSSTAMRRLLATLFLLLAVAGGAYYYLNMPPPAYFSWIEWSPEIIRAGRQVEFTVTLNSTGAGGTYRVDVYLARIHYAHVGEPERVGGFDVHIGGSGTGRGSFRYVFREPGFYVLEFRSGQATLRQLVYASPGYRSEASFTFAVFGDNRPANKASPQPEVFKRLVDEVNLIHPDFSLLLGDVIYGYRSSLARLREQWSGFMDLYLSSTVPMFVAPGNHEIQTESVPGSGNPIAQALYVAHLGRPYYAFEYGNSLFIVLDTDLVGEAYLVTGRQLTWLRGMLELGRGYRHVFVFLHKPVVTYEGGDTLGNAEQLRKMFAEYRVTAVFQGHDHTYYYRRIEGVDYYVTGGAGAPLYVRAEAGGVHHYLLVTVKGGEARVQFLPVPSFRVDEMENGTGIRVTYLFDQPLVFSRYGYTWSVEPEPVLLRGVPLRPGRVEGGRPVALDNGTLYVEALIEPGETICVRVAGSG